MDDLSNLYDPVRERIFQKIEETEISQKELANSLGISPQTITDWKNGKSNSFAKKLHLIAPVLGVTVLWLLSGTESKEKEGTSTPSIKAGQNKLYANMPGIRAVRVPILGAIPAGVPLEAIEEILDWEEIPLDWAAGGREYFGLKVKGDSMYPKYLDGDTVILRKQDTCDSGDDCAVMVNGNEATLKQVFLRDDGGLETRPLNPSYPPATYSSDDISKLPVSIAGVVVELRRKIK